MARGLASLGLEFSEEVLEPVTGYRVDIMIVLHCGDGGATGRCVVEVGMYIIRVFMFALLRQHYSCSSRCHYDIHFQNRRYHFHKKKILFLIFVFYP